MKKASDAEVITAYQQTGNIWKAATLLNLCGQSIQKRLVRLGIDRNSHLLSEADITLIQQTYIKAGQGTVDLKGLASSLGRTCPLVSRAAGKMGLTRYGRPRTVEQRKALSEATKHRLHHQGHPRGYREWRVCPACGRFFDVRHSSLQKYCCRHCVPDLLVHGEAMYSRAKSGKRADLNGQYFRSRYEANYARFLNFCIAHGTDIRKWEYEPDTFEFKAIRRGTRFYTPDFKIEYRDGHVEYHEVKGWDYPKGMTARKRMAKYYPHVILVVIDADFFKAIRQKGFHRLIEGWETP